MNPTDQLLIISKVELKCDFGHFIHAPSVDLTQLVVEKQVVIAFASAATRVSEWSLNLDELVDECLIDSCRYVLVRYEASLNLTFNLLLTYSVDMEANICRGCPIEGEGKALRAQSLTYL